MRRCCNCRHWLRSYVPADDFGWCELPIVVNDNKMPPNIEGMAYDGDAGLETHKATACSAWERYEHPSTRRQDG